MSTCIHIPGRLYIHLSCFCFLICLCSFCFVSFHFCFLMALAKVFGVVVFIRERGSKVYMIILLSLSLTFKKD